MTTKINEKEILEKIYKLTDKIVNILPQELSYQEFTMIIVNLITNKGLENQNLRKLISELTDYAVILGVINISEIMNKTKFIENNSGYLMN